MEKKEQIDGIVKELEKINSSISDLGSRVDQITKVLQKMLWMEMLKHLEGKKDEDKIFNAKDISQATIVKALHNAGLNLKEICGITGFKETTIGPYISRKNGKKRNERN